MNWNGSPKERSPRAGIDLFEQLKLSRTFGARVPEVTNFKGVARELAPKENETIVLEVNKDALIRQLEMKGGVMTFDGTITDQYFELPGEIARERIGNWPRLRCKEQNGKTQYEFTLKTGRAQTESGGTEHSEVTILAETLDGATLLMKQYLRDVMGLSEEELRGMYAFNTIKKNRTSFVVKNVNVDIDTWSGRRIAVRRADGSEAVLEEEFQGPRAKRLLPTYAEFEVVYEDPRTSPEAAQRAEALIRERDDLVTELGYRPAPNGMTNVLVHYGIPSAEEARDELKRSAEKKVA